MTEGFDTFRGQAVAFAGRSAGSRVDRSTLRPTVAIAIALAAAYAIPHALNAATPVLVEGGLVVEVNGPLHVTVPRGWFVRREESPRVVQLERDGVRVELRSPYSGATVRERISLYVLREFRTTPAEVVVGEPVIRTFPWADVALEIAYRREVDGVVREGLLIAVSWNGISSMIVDASAPAGAIDAARPDLDGILESIGVVEAFAR